MRAKPPERKAEADDPPGRHIHPVDKRSYLALSRGARSIQVGRAELRLGSKQRRLTTAALERDSPAVETDLAAH
jgi:hypothetical protein